MNDKITALLERMKGNIARCLQRDSDTLNLWNNHGVLAFRIFHEWNDSFDPTTGETGTITGETYDPDTDTFSVATTAGEPVFNGRLSGIWDLISTALPSELESMYGKMRAAGFNAESMWQLYQSFRTQWCEALYNADAMGYANTGRFDMAYGDKSEAMRFIFRRRFRYLDSKYGQNTASTVVMRLWGNGHGVAVRHYCPIYASLNWGAGAVQRRRSIKPGEPAYFENPGVTFNDTTVTLYDADLITDISSYVTLPDGTREESGLQNLGSSLMFSQGLGNCRRLKSLVLDYSGGAANTQATASTLDAAASVALRRMIVRNCPNVTGHPVFVSQVLEEVDLRGTGVTGVGFPETDTLTALRLPATTASIDLAHEGGLSELVLESTAALQSLRINDCPLLNVRQLLYEALTGGALREVSLSGVDWDNFPVRYLEALVTLPVAELTGSIALPASDNMTFDLKHRCIVKWGDIDNPDNPLHISYTSRPVDIIRISGVGYYGTPGNYQLRVMSEDPYANDFTGIEWSMAANGYAEIDAQSGVVTVSRVGDEELAPTADVTVTVTKADGTTITKTTTVGFYDRACQVGDFVYADGSYSDIFDEGRTVVCICSYIDPYDPTLRLGVAPRTVVKNIFFGAVSRVTLTDSPEYDSLYVPGLPIENCSYLTDDNLRDDSEPDGWKRYDANSANRSGFSPLNADLMQYQEAEILPVGMADTLKIIQHRNKVLRDSGINLPVPVASGGKTEFVSVSELISACDKTPGKSYNYYWPGASYAYAYEPTILQTGESLSPKFKAHKWFLGTAWDYARLAWLYKFDEKFSRLVANGRIDFGDAVVSSSPAFWAGTTNRSCNNIIKVTSYGKIVGNESQNAYRNGSVLPMVRF